MPAFKLHLVEPQETQQEEQRRKQLKTELADRTEIKSHVRNKIYPFLVNSGISHLIEIDYPLRMEFKSYVQQNFQPKLQKPMLNAFDRLKQRSMWEAQETLAGRAKYALKYENALVFLKYLPDREIAEKYLISRDDSCLVWDFRGSSSEQMKQQVFRAICSISREKKDAWSRKVALDGLRYLYQFCIKEEITDIELMDKNEEKRFADILNQLNKPEKERKGMLGVINWIQKHEFLAAKEINWNANTWYLERICIAKHRINPSNPIESLKFADIDNPVNRELFKKYIKYLIAVTDVAMSNLRCKKDYVRSFMKFLDEKKMVALKLTEDVFEEYIKRLFEKNIEPQSFNSNLLAIVQFYNFLLVRNEIGCIPFQPDKYFQKTVALHHDRSVEEKVSMEIIGKLKYFPEHLRLMYLHLWGIGLRASEVCTLKGDAYIWDGRDAWIMVWQPKMRRYKKIPIPEMLYRLMKVYIKKYDIGTDDYLFPNTNGGAFRYATLRSQMIRYCEKVQIQGGKYLFRAHDYRHNVATEFYEGGVPLSSVRDYHGHSYDEMTLQYVDHMPARVEQAAERVFENPENNLVSEFLKSSGQQRK